MSIERKPKRMVDIDLFTHPKMRGTSAMAKALFVFLLLPSPSGINCLSIRQMRLAVDPCATDAQLEHGLNQLITAGIVRWDAESETVWVIDALDQQAPGASPKIGACVRNHLLTLPVSPLVDQFRERYAEWLVRAQASDQPSDLTPTPSVSEREHVEPIHGRDATRTDPRVIQVVCSVFLGGAE